MVIQKEIAQSIRTGCLVLSTSGQTIYATLPLV
jgi:hypothetical protein